MREWWGTAIIQIKPHSLAYSSPPAVEVWFLIDQGLVLFLTHCAGIVDSCSKPSSGTFCKTNHPASTQFLNKWMALKLWEEQLFHLKGEQPSTTYEYILSTVKRHLLFEIQENLQIDWILNVNLGGTNSIFFNIPLFYTKYSLCTFCELFISSLKYFRKNE